MQSLPSDHFLELPRPESEAASYGRVDTTTLAAHDFDVDNRTGFMPPQSPIARLPSSWEAWEVVLEDAIQEKLHLGDAPGLEETEIAKSAVWRDRVYNLPVLPTSELKKSELVLRRAHHVLAWIMHFYIHTLAPNDPVRIPPSITVPLLQVSNHLLLPPVLTYSDDVLYNWSLKNESSSSTPELENLKCNSLFTSTKDEEEFYMTSARMELRGVEALELMRATMDEAFVGDDIAIRRITTILHRLAVVIKDLQDLLVRVREGCDPEFFYKQIRPWFRGQDSDKNGRKWVFEGLELDPSLSAPEELSGPSAGQSALIHSLDIFLGVDQYSHSSSITGQSSASTKRAFLERMQTYMPRHHRNFLNHLAANPRPLRELVLSRNDAKLLEAYNDAVSALKRMRDAHIIIVTLYIISPARREEHEKVEREGAAQEKAALKGTGGTELAKFLKDVRDGTARTIIRD